VVRRYVKFRLDYVLKVFKGCGGIMLQNLIVEIENKNNNVVIYKIGIV
jgi:hypothetical protein